MSTHYDRQGNALTFEEFLHKAKTQTKAERDAEHRVAADVLPNGYWVSTVHLGLDHSFGQGPPLIFETMVFPCDADGHVTSWSEEDCDRYSTEAGALAGHAAMVEKWRKPQPSSDGERP